METSKHRPKRAAGNGISFSLHGFLAPGSHVERPGNYKEQDRKIIWIYLMLQMRKWSIQYRVLIKVAIVVHEEGNTLCNKQEPKVLLIYRQAKLQCSLILECYTCIYHACVYYDATRQSQTCHTLVTHKIIASHYTPQAWSKKWGKNGKTRNIHVSKLLQLYTDKLPKGLPVQSFQQMRNCLPFAIEPFQFQSCLEL